MKSAFKAERKVLRKAHSSRLSRATVKLKTSTAQLKQTKDATGRSQAHLAAAQRIAHVGSWEAELRSLEDFSRNPLWWSEETFRIFGYEPGSVEATHELFGNAIAPEDRGRVWTEVQAALHERKRYEVEHRVIRPDGSARVVLEHAEVIYDRTGKRPLRFIGTVQDITERKQAEELLGESSKAIQDLYDNAPCGYHSLDKSGVIVRINDTELKWLGYRREEIVGRMKFSDLITPEGLQVYDQTFPMLKERGWIHDIETEMIRKDGTVLPVLLSATALRDDKGDFVATRSTVFDITERRRMENALRASEAHFRQTVEAAAVPLSVDGADGKIEYLNRQFIETFGYTREELPDHAAWFARAYPQAEYRQAVARRWDAAVARAVTEGKPIGPVEAEVTCKNGSVRTVEFVGTAVGHRLLIAAKDLTEHKRAEKALRQSEEKFRRIAANIEDAIYSVDARTREFCYLSPAFEKMLGYTLDDIRNMGGRSAFLSRVIYKGKFDEQKGRFERWKSPPVEIAAVCDEEWWRCKDGTLKCIEDRWMPVYEAGRLATTDGVLCDVTERKRTEQAIRASLEEKTVLLKEVHHRVKNNLQIVVSLLNLQAVRVKNPAALDTLQETGNRVRSMALLHETLYLSESLAQVNFGSYIESICGHLFRSYGPKAARVKLERRMEEASIDLDQAVACGLIINELVSNALKHAFPDGRVGRITVELQTAAQEQIVLRVADDGVGLPARLDIRQTETLGHQLVFMLAEKLRGAVEVTRDQGTAFRITFQTKHGEERV